MSLAKNWIKKLTNSPLSGVVFGLILLQTSENDSEIFEIIYK